MKDPDIQMCLNCPLPDCYPTDPRCPILRKSAKEAGLTLADVPADAPIQVGRRKYEGLVPEHFTDKSDYQKQYNRAYHQRFRKILLKGVYLKRRDIELLQSVCTAEGRTLEGVVVVILELMVDNARRRGM